MPPAATWAVPSPGSPENCRDEIDDVEPEAAEQFGRKCVDIGGEGGQIAFEQPYSGTGTADRLARDPFRLPDEGTQSAAIDGEQRYFRALRFACFQGKVIASQEPLSRAHACRAAIVAEGLPTAEEQAEQEISVTVREMAP